MADRPWHTMSIDTMGPLPAVGGKRLIISLIDVFSCYEILFPTADNKVYTIAMGLFQQLVAYFGVLAHHLEQSWL